MESNRLLHNFSYLFLLFCQLLLLRFWLFLWFLARKRQVSTQIQFWSILRRHQWLSRSLCCWSPLNQSWTDVAQSRLTLDVLSICIIYFRCVFESLGLLLFKFLLLLLLLGILLLYFLEVFLQLLILQLARRGELFVVDIISIIEHICILFHGVAVFNGSCLFFNLLLD